MQDSLFKGFCDIQFTYFKPTGKYYSEATYTYRFNGKLPEMNEIFTFVWNLLNAGCHPGLTCTKWDYYDVLVEVVNHPRNVPHLFKCPKVKENENNS